MSNQNSWTETETSNLTATVTVLIQNYDIDSQTISDFWKTVQDHMQKKFDSSRSAESCKSKYGKIRASVGIDERRHVSKKRVSQLRKDKAEGEEVSAGAQTLLDAVEGDEDE